MQGMMRRGLRGLQEYEDELPPLQDIPTVETETMTKKDLPPNEK